MITGLVLWFAWAGTFWGWVLPWLNAVSIGLGVAWAAWLLVTARGPGPAIVVTNWRACWNRIIDQLSPLELALWCFLVVALLSGIFSVDPRLSLWRIGVLLAYLVAFYVVRRRYTAHDIARGVVLAGWILFGIGLVEWVYRWWHGLAAIWLFCNPNLIAMLWVLVIPVGLGHLRGRDLAAWGVLGCTVMIATNSRGGVLGLAVALLVLYWPRLWPVIRYSSVASLLTGAVLLVASRPSTNETRMIAYGSALAGFLGRPVLGWGPGTFALLPHPGDWFYSHNMILTVACEMGLMGLMALAVLLWEIWRMRDTAPRWVLAALAGFAAHSLVDEPIWFWGPGLGVMALLALLSQRDRRT